ncbi:MAG: hypothetical protein U5L09_02270 [Bacteroidales bacterium]|nr:hypothetical protein [Bacteroidales bacterium]
MTDLSSALKVNQTKFKDKAVKSVRSRVTNIQEHLPQNHKDLTVMDFKSRVMDHIVNNYPETELYQLTAEDDKAIRELMKKKYMTCGLEFWLLPKIQLLKNHKNQRGPY